MKLSLRSDNFPGFCFLVAGILLIVILYSIQWYGKISYRPGRQIISFSKTLDEKSTRAEKTLKKISEITKKNYYYVNEIPGLIKPDETDEGIYFYLFSNDSLVFWSENSVNPSGN